MYVALLATLTLSLTACGDDDDEPDSPSAQSGEFVFDGKSMYLRNSGALDYVRDEGVMQINFSLYKEKDAFSGEEMDVYPTASASIEIKPFDVTTTAKGKKLEVMTSRYTYTEYFPSGFDGNYLAGKYYFKPTAGSVIFEGYDSATEVVTLKIDLTMANKTESVSMKGSIRCEYTDPSYTLESWEGKYDY